MQEAIKPERENTEHLTLLFSCKKDNMITLKIVVFFTSVEQRYSHETHNNILTRRSRIKIIIELLQQLLNYFILRDARVIDVDDRSAYVPFCYNIQLT